MSHRFLHTTATGAAIVVTLSLALAGQEAPRLAGKTNAKSFVAPRTSWGQPDLQGVWDQTTGTPLERPAVYKGRKFLTDQEAADRERQRFAEFDQAGRAGGTGDYGSVWREGSKNALNMTALIVDPEDGRIPALTPEGRKAADARSQARKGRGEADSLEDRSLWER